MPNGLLNWNFNDVVEFLKFFGFELVNTPGGSHYYFQGEIDDKTRLVEVQFHASKDISPATMKDYIVPRSGIRKDYWIEWAAAGNNKARKRIDFSMVKYKHSTKENSFEFKE